MRGTLLRDNDGPSVSSVGQDVPTRTGTVSLRHRMSLIPTLTPHPPVRGNDEHTGTRPPLITELERCGFKGVVILPRLSPMRQESDNILNEFHYSHLRTDGTPTT